ncbi:MAG: hypothetical protein ACREP9_20730 [Candidatus Dormibacteraceae bacterium]
MKIIYRLGWRRTGQVVVAGALSVSLLAAVGGTALAVRSQNDDYVVGTAKAKNTPIRQSPVDNSPVNQTAEPGDVLHIYCYGGVWYDLSKYERPYGGGWSRASSIVVADPRDADRIPFCENGKG